MGILQEYLLLHRGNHRFKLFLFNFQICQLNTEVDRFEYFLFVQPHRNAPSHIWTSSGGKYTTIVHLQTDEVLSILVVENFSYTSQNVPMFTPKCIMEIQNNIVIPPIRLIKLCLICQVRCTIVQGYILKKKNIDIICVQVCMKNPIIKPVIIRAVSFPTIN